jgi:FkbM family methyltransferase
MNFSQIDRLICDNIPTDFLRDFYPRAMRRLAENGLFSGNTQVETLLGFKMNVNRVDAIKWYLHYFGVFEPQITQAWRNHLQPGDTVLDIGGNIGFHALVAAVAVGKTGHVHTFEPMAKIYEELIANIRLNDLTQLTGHKFAISDKVGKFNFYDGDEKNWGSSSLLPTRSNKVVDVVDCITFAEVARIVDLASVSLIKIDVEGAEKDVLNGLAKYIPTLQHKCAIFLEIDPLFLEQSDTFLAPYFKAGFGCKVIRNDYKTAFYRQQPKPQFSDFPPANRNLVCDVVLCRDASRYAVMSG